MSMTDSEYRRSAAQAAEHYFALAEQRFGRSFVRVAVFFDLKGRTAGQAWFPAQGEPFIRLNMELLRANHEDFLVRTIGHEVAHVVDRVIAGRARIRPHGASWRAVMAAFGLPATRCHQYQTTAARKPSQTFPFRCGCRTWQFTIVRKRRVARGVVYSCPKCQTALVPDTISPEHKAG